MKKLIICIIGESGAGKTTLAEDLRKTFGIKLLESYTDRPKRTSDEIGHIFLTSDEFNEIPTSDMIAYTTFGNFQYCCLFSDLENVNSYVIDEDGFLMLKKLNKSQYELKSIRIICNESERIKRAGLCRYERDKGRFKIPLTEFDMVYSSDNHKSILECKNRIEIIKSWIKPYLS